MELPSRDDPLRSLAVYLERFGEALADPQNLRFDALLRGSYRWVLVVPAFDEPIDFLQTVLQNLSFAHQSQALLVICVINAPTDAPPTARARTLASLPTNRTGPGPGKDTAAATEPDTPDLRPLNDSSGIHVLTIDAATEPLPADQATGLARKLGNDIACHLMLRGRIRTLLLCNTDADAILPADYFLQLAQATSSGTTPGVCILPFTHISDQPDLQAAGQIYELYLRSLYLNLAACGSPYAYPALGSLLAINPVLYAKSRGFPKRRAGEDFYLLNKIAKLADVSYLAGSAVELQARASARVPFGTGPAIEKALSLTTADYPSYSRSSFALLKRFYGGFAELGKPANSRPSVRGPMWPAAWQDPDLLWLLKRLGLPTVLKKLQSNHPTAPALQRALHEWFDALKIVRFLNEARHFHPDEPLMAQADSLPLQPAAQSKEPLSEGFTRSDLSPTEINRALESNRSTSRHGVGRRQ